MKYWILFGVLTVLSYFMGNFNFAVIISKLKNKDIRKQGSGNPGTLNMSRTFGLKTGLITFFLDVMKGAVPAFLGWIIFKDVYVGGTNFELADLAKYTFGFAAVIGHIYPVFMKFKGGKGIATTIGVFTLSLITCSIERKSFAWAAISIMAIVAAIAFIYFTEFGAMGSFIAITPMAVGSSVYLYITYVGTNPYNEAFVLYFVSQLIILAICFFTWFAHRKNIERMLEGEEHATSIKKMIMDSRKKKEEKIKAAKEKNETKAEDKNG